MKTRKANFRGDYSRHYVAQQWVEYYIHHSKPILDMGYDNKFAQKMRGLGYKVHNTPFDLDLKSKRLLYVSDFKWVTAFEVFEHLLDPYCVLNTLPSGTHMLCSVPLRVWFKRPHWIKDEPLRQHYHEFLPREFYKLLHKAGWTIQTAQKECIVKQWGIRPLLTWLFQIKRYLFVVAYKM